MYDNGHKFVERYYSISVEETKNKASFMFVLSLKLRNRVDYDSDASQTQTNESEHRLLFSLNGVSLMVKFSNGYVISCYPIH